MNIYSFNSPFDEKGNHTHRFAFPAVTEDWSGRLRMAFETGGAFEMEWDQESAPIGTLVGGLMSGFRGAREVFERMRCYMEPNRGVASLTGLGGDYVFVAPQNIRHIDASNDLPHLFMSFPKHDGCLVTERFKDEWERQGYTGAAFKKVMELRDSQFVPIPEQR